MIDHARNGRAFILDWPTGSGKTLGVLDHLRRSSGSTRTFQSSIAKSIVVIPARRMRDAWLRDLGLRYIQHGQIQSGDLEPRCRTKADAKKLWRGFGPLKKERLLHEGGLPTFHFMTYREFFKRTTVPPELTDRQCRVLVLDEWHRVGRRKKANLLADYQLGKAGRNWWNMRHPINAKARRTVYLCSATPLNPAQEDRAEDVSDFEKSEATFESRLDFELQCAVAIVGTMSGISLSDVQNWKHIRGRGVRIMSVPPRSRKIWRRPVDTRSGVTEVWRREILETPGVRSILSRLRRNEVDVLKSILQNRSGYGYEYNYVAGIVATKAFSRREHRLANAGSKSFGEAYKAPYLAGVRKKAKRWLTSEHGRVTRLLIVLASLGVVELRVGAGKRQSLSFNLKPGEKAVIFCVHQATARGLREALRSLCRDQKPADEIKSSLDVGVKRSRKTSKDLISKFNFEPFPSLLIATDALSESYDLHEKCSVVVHYELPWSPYRIFQRVGRVTRIRAEGRACNEGRAGHVIVPGSTEEERVNRLIRRMKLLASHHLLPGISKGQWTDHVGAIRRYLGVGPSRHLRDYLRDYASERSGGSRAAKPASAARRSGKSSRAHVSSKARP